MSRRTLIAAAFAGGGLVALAAAPAAHATYTVTFTEVGGDVVANGSGSIDFAGLIPDGTGAQQAHVTPSSASEFTGPAASTSVSFYAFASGPGNFGPGNGTFASSGSGDMVGLDGGLVLAVPLGYMSGAPLSDTSTYSGTTLAALGLTLGTYTYTFGSGANADSFIIKVGGSGPSVPEPGTLMLLTAGLLGLGLVRRKAA